MASLDARLRGFFAGLERRGVLDKAIVVFTADHGEAFREHGQLPRIRPARPVVYDSTCR